MSIFDDKYDLIRDADEAFASALGRADQVLLKDLTDILGKFSVSGSLTFDPQLLASLEADVIEKLFNNNTSRFIQNYLKSIPIIADFNGIIQRQVNGIPKKATEELLQESLKLRNFLTLLQDNLQITPTTSFVSLIEGQEVLTTVRNPALNQLISPITNIVRQDIIAGVSFESATERIRSAISTKEIGLESYSTVIARDALLQADGLMNQTISEGFNLPYLKYVGSIAENTRPFCVHMVRNVKTILFEDLQKKVLNKYIPAGVPSQQPVTYRTTGKPKRSKKGNGLIAGTNESNFYTRRGGYACRHQAIPVRKP